ncbi:hypothetical protein MJH12_15100, partial [bacterium]|nr:hypothetical protein [bacterium]
MEQKQEELIDIKTIIYFLFGHRESILKVANCRDSFKLSFFMVMTAALARSYDKESLFQEPFHLILSPLASAFVALIIFLAFRLLLFRKSLECPPLWRHFRLFLTLFWMTAPLAWIYGFPVEQFLGPILAARVNLYFLGIVALWRVILFIRICQCYFGGVALTTVLLVCSSIAATLLNVIPMPIISVMGGVNIEGADALINLSAMLILALSLMSLPVLSFLYLIFLNFGIGIIYEEPPSSKRVVK